MANILVVDDEEDLLTVVKQALEQAGHAVSVACDGGAGLKQFQQGRFDLVVCELFMPVQDGFDMLKHLRQLRPDLPIIIMSGGSSAGSPNLGRQVDYLHMASEFGASGTLEKPFQLADLVDMVTRVLSDIEAKL
jgi:CheY-like chemotaxis protein